MIVFLEICWDAELGWNTCVVWEALRIVENSTL